MYSLASLAAGNTSSQNQSTKPHHYACWEGLSATQKRKPVTENPGASPRNVTLLLKTIWEKSGFSSCNFCPLSSFQLSLPSFILRCIPAWHCVVSVGLADILCSHRPFQPHAAAQLLPQMGKSLFATAAVGRGLGGRSNPWLTSTAFPGDAGDRDGTLNLTEISQHRKESESSSIVWVAKHESFLNPDHAFLPLKSDFPLNQTKPNQTKYAWWNPAGSALLKWGQLWGAWTYLAFEFICPCTWDQTEKRGRREHISHQIRSSEHGPGNRTGV